MTNAKTTPTDPPFVMKLLGPKEEMHTLVERLRVLGADVVVTSQNATTARIVAKVPQEHARRAMAFAGLP
jgi:hypothetical protein